jgi:hypothetical protein
VAQACFVLAVSISKKNRWFPPPPTYQMKRNDDALTGEEARRLDHAFGDDEFCRLMAEYATEILDPKYKEEQEAYLAQLEARNELPFGRALVWPSRYGI